MSGAALLAAALRQRERLPVDGLVALYDFSRGNFVNWSEEFTNAGWARFNVTVTATALNVQGLPVFRIEDTSTTARGDLSISAAPVAVGQRVYVGLIVKADTSAYMAFRLTLNAGAGGNPTCGVDLTTGAVTPLGGGSPTGAARDLGGGFWEVVMSVTALEAASRPNMLIMPAGLNAASFNTASAAAPATGAVLATAARMGYGSPAYERTTDGQLLLDRSGNGRHATLGSAAGADTNDPAWTAAGLSFDGVDDTVLLPAGLLPLEYTVLAVTTQDPATTSNGRLLGVQLGGTANTVEIQRDNTSETVALRSNVNGTVTLAQAGSNGQFPKGVAVGVAVGHNRSNGMTRFWTGGQPLGSGANPAPHINTLAATTGRLGQDAVGATPMKGVYHAFALYSRVLSDAEIARAYRVIRRQLAARGVILP